MGRKKKERLGTGSEAIQPCKHIFLDLGANRGDTFGKFVDAGIPSCDTPGEPRRLRYNSTQALFDGYHTRKTQSEVLFWAESRMKTYSSNKKHAANGQTLDLDDENKPIGPEDYCYIGVEGNPRFTQTLQQLQHLSLQPRPTKDVHFLTETVVSDVDGPVKFYIDSLGGKYSFPGSSIVSNKLMGNEKIPSKEMVTVAGISLATLLKQAVSTSSFEGTTGGHVMIKMDIEGAEYQVLNAVAQSGIMCALVQEHHVVIDLLFEPHPITKFGGNKLEGDEILHNTSLRQLRECGIDVQIGE